MGGESRKRKGDQGEREINHIQEKSVAKGIFSGSPDNPDAVPSDEGRTRSNVKRALAAPATRRLARKLNVDIEQITGTGPNGRVMEEDVRRAAAEQQFMHEHDGSEHPVTLTGETEGPEGPVSDRFRGRRSVQEQSHSAEKFELTGLRGVIAKNMTQSAFTIPHVTHFDEVDVTELIRVRERVKQKVATRGVKLTYVPFFMKAIVVALQEFPVFNATWSEDGKEVWMHKTCNIGVAVDTEEGLVVPVVRDVNMKSVVDIARELEALVEKARKRRLTRDDMSGGTFTVGNVGPMGGMFATPIIRYPEVALMAFHKIKPRPVVVTENGERKVAVRDMMNVSISFDYRIADGVAVVRFTNRILELLEEPEALMIELM